MIDDRAEEVGLEIRPYPLDDRRETLESHPGVDIVLGQRKQRSVLLEIELREDEVPYLEIPVAVAAHPALRPAARKGRSLVVQDLGTRTAWPLVAHEPEVLVLVEAVNPLVGKSDRVPPDRVRFLVVLVDGRIQSRTVETDDIRQKLPRPGDRFVFEVIAPAEISEHLEERMMSRGASHVVDIVRPDAFLRRDGPGDLGFHDAEVIRLERHHPSNGEKKRRVVRNQGKARIVAASPGNPEIDEFLADLFPGSPLHGPTLPHSVARRISDRRVSRARSSASAASTE